MTYVYIMSTPMLSHPLNFIKFQRVDFTFARNNNNNNNNNNNPTKEINYLNTNNMEIAYQMEINEINGYKTEIK